MIFKQCNQVVGLKEPPKSQTRRVNFPYELAVQLWKHGWSYPRNNRRTSGGHVYRSYTPWDEWQERHPISDEQIAEANRILAEHVIILAVQPGRGKKSKGRIHVQRIRRERLGDISDADCLAEGVIRAPDDGFLAVYRCPICGDEWFESPIGAYMCLWNCCGGRWETDQNDDVWVLEFEKGPGRQ